MMGVNSKYNRSRRQLLRLSFDDNFTVKKSEYGVHEELNEKCGMCEGLSRIARESRIQKWTPWKITITSRMYVPQHAL